MRDAPQIESYLKFTTRVKQNEVFTLYLKYRRSQ